MLSISSTETVKHSSDHAQVKYNTIGAIVVAYRITGIFGEGKFWRIT